MVRIPGGLRFGAPSLFFLGVSFDRPCEKNVFWYAGTYVGKNRFDLFDTKMFFGGPPSGSLGLKLKKKKSSDSVWLKTLLRPSSD